MKKKKANEAIVEANAQFIGVVLFGFAVGFTLGSLFNVILIIIG